jgi:hypothetical protein
MHTFSTNETMNSAIIQSSASLVTIVGLGTLQTSLQIGQSLNAGTLWPLPQVFVHPQITTSPQISSQIILCSKQNSLSIWLSGARRTCAGTQTGTGLALILLLHCCLPVHLSCAVLYCSSTVPDHRLCCICTLIKRSPQPQQVRSAANSSPCYDWWQCRKPAAAPVNQSSHCNSLQFAFILLPPSQLTYRFSSGHEKYGMHRKREERI